VVALVALIEENPMHTTVRRSLVAAATFVWIALVISPAQALIPPEPGAPAIAPPGEPGPGASFFDRVPWMAAGAGIVLAVAVVIGAVLLLTRSHHAHAMQAQAH
jgi:hypothetical protein